jgi:hypothetical protein
VPIYKGTEGYERTVLLFLHDGHYSAIKSWNRFCGSDGVDNYTCSNCFSHFGKKESYERHVKICNDLNENGSHVVMPKEGSTTQFSAHDKCHKAPIVIYGDFETAPRKLSSPGLKPVERCVCSSVKCSCKQEGKGSKHRSAIRAQGYIV